MPDDPGQLLQMAVQHLQAGNAAAAERACRDILARHPGHADTLHFLGYLAYQAGRIGDGIALMEASIAAQPGNAAYHSNIGSLLVDAGRPEEGVEHCRRAVALQPKFAEAHNNLGRALSKLEQWSAAAFCYAEATNLNPQYALAMSNLGQALTKMGKPADAVDWCQRAISLQPGLVVAYNNLVSALMEMFEREKALAVCRRAVAIDPSDADAQYNLGRVLWELYQSDEAAECYRRSLALKAGAPDALIGLANALKDIGELDEALAYSRQAAQVPSPDQAMRAGNYLFKMHFHPAFDAQAIYREHAAWNEKYAQPLAAAIRPRVNAPDPERRIKVGFVSPDLREHPVGRFLLPLLAEHDRGAFEFICYSATPEAGALTPVLRGHADGWHDIVRLDDQQAADLIYTHEIDILIDVTLHTGRNRMLVFARKPAPVQMTWLGCNSTTGLTTIDYRISDPYVDPAGEAEWYSEKTIRLPDTSVCYVPPESAGGVSALPALTAGHVTFGCLNNFSKISKPASELWAQLLAAVPGSRLVLHPQEGRHRQKVLNRFASLGIDAARIAFLGRVSWPDYFHAYDRIDVALDPFPYNGVTTTCDALYMGVPVVTLAGATAVSRAGASILSNVGHGDLVARTVDEYLRIAVNLTADLPRLAELRGTLRQRMERSPLMDAAGFTRHFETLLRGAWREWCKSQVRMQG